MLLPCEEKDLLFSAATEFNKLVGKRIELTLGRKRLSEKVVILFDPKGFHHLVGLHKLSDIPPVSKPATNNIFNDILNRKICITDIKKSTHFNEITDRLEIVNQINDIFTKDNHAFKFLKLVNPNSQIKWKYLLEFSTIGGYQAYLFLQEFRNNPGSYFCISGFRKKSDYSFGQTRMTLLQTKLIDNSTEKILYRSASYKTSK